ncbi:MAG: hypothetical protein ACC628_13240 [Pirellulaceae bacterium]
MKTMRIAYSVTISVVAWLMLSTGAVCWDEPPREVPLLVLADHAFVHVAFLAEMQVNELERLFRSEGAKKEGPHCGPHDKSGGIGKNDGRRGDWRKQWGHLLAPDRRNHEYSQYCQGRHSHTVPSLWEFLFEP